MSDHYEPCYCNQAQEYEDMLFEAVTLLCKLGEATSDKAQLKEISKLCDKIVYEIGQFSYQQKLLVNE